MKKILPVIILTCLLAFSPTWHIPSFESPRSGKDFALFFAVKDYDSWTDLTNPIIDAEAIAKELREGYGFQTEVVKNPTKQEVLSKLQEYRNKTYASDGQLLVFFSGHGAFVEDTKEGFFIPRDARKNDPFQESYLPHERLENWTAHIPCKHILVAIDACYSGTFSKGLAYKSGDWERPGEGSGALERFIHTSLEPKTRLFVTSGGKQRTPDPSEFAEKFLDGLKQSRRDRTPVVTIEELYVNHIKQASPKPKFGAFGENEYDSQFLFVLKGQTSLAQNDPIQDRYAWKEAKVVNTISVYQFYLSRFPQGEFRSLADQRIAQLEDYEAWQQAKDADTKTTYERYLGEYPDGAYRELSEAALKELRGQSISPSDRNSAKEEESRPGPVITNRKIETAPNNMVFVEGGTFMMGCTSEQGKDCKNNGKPTHQVTVKSFYLGKYEVTNKEFCRFLNEKGNQTEGKTAWIRLAFPIEKSGNKFVVASGFENKPVDQVYWYGACAYCVWLSDKTGKSFRLPTEAEWEYAARGGRKSQRYKYAGSNNLDEVGWHDNNSLGSSWPVGQKKPNELGIYDMSGNVTEWCQDYWNDSYKNAPINGQAWLLGDSTSRVTRGGSYNWTRFCSAAYRNDRPLDIVLGDEGFRVVQELE